MLRLVFGKPDGIFAVSWLAMKIGVLAGLAISAILGLGLLLFMLPQQHVPDSQSVDSH